MTSSRISETPTHVMSVKNTLNASVLKTVHFSSLLRVFLSFNIGEEHL
jgi:hypothetical protein